jgi:quinol monooxygenase YgiN
MIREVAHLEIDPARTEDFLAGYRAAIPLFLAARGCRSVALERCVEQPGRFHLLVVWETLEDHTVHFRNSEDFQKWRGLVGAYFAAPPQVIHFKVEEPTTAN